MITPYTDQSRSQKTSLLCGSQIGEFCNDMVQKKDLCFILNSSNKSRMTSNSQDTPYPILKNYGVYLLTKKKFTLS